MASSTHYNWVLMKDIVSYKPPFGLLGCIANTLLIKIKLTEIFDYRTKAFENLFPS
jgi:ligand-binding SRPBCC domain-containing protein